MSPRFAPDDIDLVREKSDIVDIVSEHVRLKRAGRSYKGLCPFHQEKTPSFTVDRDKGLYYCHGCQAGGSVFTFLEQLEGLSFGEAVETLARRSGVSLREVSGERRAPSQRSRLLGLHEAAVEHYQERLLSRDAAPVRDYLTERDVDEATAARYRIGFGGWGRDGLVRTLVRKGVSSEELLTAGLATRDARGIRDTFFGRLLFPIFDPSDRCVGFGGRVLPEAHRRPGAPEGPKYLNSRETPVFRKSRILYGTNWARGEIVRSRRLVLVEGYTDVIALHKAGVGDAVATCGTSLTEDHMKEISTRFGDVRVVLCLDADVAGQAAMSRQSTEDLAGAYSPGERVRGGWLPVGRGWLPEVYVARLPAGSDPAEFAEAEGAAGMERVIGEAVPLIRFLLNAAVAGEDLKSPEGRARAVRKAGAVLGQVGDGLLRHEYVLWLADRVGVDAHEVARTVETTERRPQSRRGVAESTAPVVLTGSQRIERAALTALVQLPELANADDVPVEDEDFTHPLHRSLFRLVFSGGGASPDLGAIAGTIQDTDLRKLASELAMAETPDLGAARETLTRLKGTALARRIEELKKRLRTLDPEREAEAYDSLFEDLLKLEKERRALGSTVPL